MHRTSVLLHRVLVWVVAAGLFIASAPLSAEGQCAVDDPELEEEPDEIEVLDATRRALYGSAYWLVENVDSWFGDKPFEEGGRVAGTLRIRTLYRDDSIDTDFRYRLRVDMPNVSEFGYILIGRENEQELIRDEDEAFSRERSLLPESGSEDQTFFVGIGRMIRENVDLRLGVRGGYRVFAQARYRKSWWLLPDISNIEYRQTLFLAVDDGLGTTTGLNYAHALNANTAFRWRNSATFGTETDGVEWSTSLGLFRSLDRRRDISFELLANGDTEGAVLVNEYGLRTTYSQPIHQDWIIGELIGGYFWPREDDDPARDQTVALGLGVEIRF